MYMRGAKVTFANELMKNSFIAFMSSQTDLVNDMMFSMRVHLSEHQLLLVQVFPSKEAADNHGQQIKDLIEQMKDSGIRMEPLRGDISHFKVAGGITLEQLNDFT